MKPITTILIAAALFLGGCEKDFKEINTNPNKPEHALSYALFNGSNKIFADKIRDYDTSGRIIRSWMQYTAQTTYTRESSFLYDDYSGDYIWKYAYQVAGNYKKIIDLNTNPETKIKTALYGDNQNQIAAARIMMSYVFSLLTETFGDIPYYSWSGRNNDKFQALQLEKYISPQYASQKDIYENILIDLKEAVQQINTTKAYVFKEGDLLFRTPQKLKRFGNSLRLRIANRVKDVPYLQALAQQTINELKDGTQVLQSNGDTVELPYENNETNPSPIYKNYFVQTRTDYTPANTFVSILKGERGSAFGLDPRLQKFFAPINHNKKEVRDGKVPAVSDITQYQGMPYGIEEELAESQFKTEKGVSLFSQKILSANYAEVFLEYAEVCFLLSEVNNWDQAWYEKGVKASLEKWGVEESKVTHFIRHLPAANQANVLTQKYISLYMNPNEAWAEYRRTGYPNNLIKVGERVPLNIPVGGLTHYTFSSQVAGLTDIPERLYYPATYKLINFDHYQNALRNMGITEDKMNHPLLFTVGRSIRP